MSIDVNVHCRKELKVRVEVSVMQEWMEIPKEPWTTLEVNGVTFFISDIQEVKKLHKALQNYVNNYKELLKNAQDIEDARRKIKS